MPWYIISCLKLMQGALHQSSTLKCRCRGCFSSSFVCQAQKLVPKAWPLWEEHGGTIGFLHKFPFDQGYLKLSICLIDFRVGLSSARVLRCARRRDACDACFICSVSTRPSMFRCDGVFDPMAQHLRHLWQKNALGVAEELVSWGAEAQTMNMRTRTEWWSRCRCCKAAEQRETGGCWAVLCPNSGGPQWISKKDTKDLLRASVAACYQRRMRDGFLRYPNNQLLYIYIYILLLAFQTD